MIAVDGLGMLGASLGVIGAVVGATWALRTKLSDIEVALRGHVAEDIASFAAHDSRLKSLEQKAKTRRARRR